MKKIDLKQMGKDLYPTTSYKKIAEMEKLLHEFWDVNTTFTMNTTMLIKILSMLMYEKNDAYYTKDGNVDTRMAGIRNLLNRKKGLISDIRTMLEEVEAEIIKHEEVLGGYDTEIKKPE